MPPGSCPIRTLERIRGVAPPDPLHLFPLFREWGDRRVAMGRGRSGASDEVGVDDVAVDKSPSGMSGTPGTLTPNRSAI